MNVFFLALLMTVVFIGQVLKMYSWVKNKDFVAEVEENYNG